MRIIEYRYGEPVIHAEPSVACLGFFDGVHLGHRTLIKDAVELADRRGLVPSIVTFPAEEQLIKKGAARLYSTEQKLEIFSSLGVRCVVICDFGSVLSLSAEEFVSGVLCRDLGVQVAVAGEDFRFGYRASGDSAALVSLMRANGYDAVIHGMQTCELPEGAAEISASLIRKYLSVGGVETAAMLLGAPYRISGVISRGRGIGRSYGYPTINTELPASSPLARGVYRTEVRIGSESYVGLTNVGTCPTFGERAMHAETFVLDFSRDAYGERAEISFLNYLREERAFSGAAELAAEIEKNVKEALDLAGGRGE